MRYQAKRIFSLFLIFTLLFSTVPTNVLGKAYDPNTEYAKLDLRFWEDEQPDVGFYINAAARYIIETVQEPSFGTIHGEWSIMNLLRGMYTGYDYITHIPEGYFEEYIDRVEEYVKGRNGNLDRNKSTEWSRAILALTALGYDITDVAGYDFIEKLSESHRFSYRQGINGPIWEIIAMNTGGYEFYPNPDNEDVNTFGKMIDYILEQEIEQKDGTVGGWALASFLGGGPDPDITGMALQALAPYYKNKEKYDTTGAKTPYKEFEKAVERGVKVLADMQAENGAFKAFGQVNTESTAQVIVALTALGFDPLASTIKLGAIGEEVTFLTKCGEEDGVTTCNMIDALLSFWAEKSGRFPEVGGFKHVTYGNDGGSGSGYGVNAMATDQGLYALIAYDRFRKGLPSLYDMTDMVKGEYKEMLEPKEHDVTFVTEINSFVIEKASYGVVDLPEAEEEVEGKEFIGWNSKEDGRGTFYRTGERLVVPEHDITLYAQYDLIPFDLTFELNGGQFVGEVIDTYTIEEEIILPKASEVEKEGYQFAGWYDNEALEGEPITTLSKGTTGNKIFYAKWEQLPLSDVEATMVEEIEGFISELPTVEKVTLQNEGLIERVKAGFTRLPKKLQEKVENSTHLFNLENKIIELKEARAKEVEELIEGISLNENELRTVAAEDESNDDSLLASIEKVREHYYALTVVEEELISSETKDKFSQLEQYYFEAKEMSDKEAQVNIAELRLNGLRTSEILSQDEKQTIENTLAFVNKVIDETEAGEKFAEKIEELTSLLEAEKELERKLAELEQTIENLPSLENLTQGDVDSVFSVKEKYDSLNEYERFLVSSYGKLLELVKEAEKLQEDAEKDEGTEGDDNTNGSDDESEETGDTENTEGSGADEESNGTKDEEGLRQGNDTEGNELEDKEAKGEETEEIEKKEQTDQVEDEDNNEVANNQERNLPSTATYMYTLIAFGILLIVTGVVLRHLRIREN